MFARALSILLLVAVLTGCQTAETIVTEPTVAVPATLDRPDRPVPFDIPVPATFRQAVERGTRTMTGEPGPEYWTQDATYDIHARLDPDARAISGQTTIVYRNNSPDRLPRLHVELAQNLHAEGVVRNVPSEVTGGMNVASVSVDGVELTAGGSSGPRYVVDGTQLVVIPPEHVLSGGEVELDIEWSFDVPQAGASGRMGYDGDNLFFIAYWYPLMSVYDDIQGWHTAPFRGRAEFYGGFGDYHVTIEAPGDWLIHATGELLNPEAVLHPDIAVRMNEAYQSDEPVRVVGPADFGAAATSASADDWIAWRFSAREVRDFAFSATRESIWDAARAPVGDRDGDGSMDYTAVNSLYRESAPFWQDVTEYQQHSIAFLSSYTGISYPWPHMTAVEGGNIIGGGMEFPMMTLMGDYNQRGQRALYYVTAHELAHMWVPMIVSNNERSFTWMDEGITTFHENKAREDFFPGRNHHLDDMQAYVGLARADMESPMMHPSDFIESTTAFTVASYMKPSTVLVALRAVLGPEVFEEARRTFLAEWSYRHPHPLDFFNTFERVSGEDLDWFWETWYYQTWALDQAVERVEQNDGTATIVVRDLAEAPMPVLLSLTLEDGTVMERRIPVDVWLSGTRQTSLDVETSAPVVRVDIDPEYHFPDIDRTNNSWAR